MTENTNLRKVELLKDSKWVEIPYKQLKRFDVFKLFEPDGEPILNVSGNPIFIAQSNVYPNRDGIDCVELEEGFIV